MQLVRPAFSVWMKHGFGGGPPVVMLARRLPGIMRFHFSGFLGDTLFPQLTACIQSVLSVESGMGGGVSFAEPPHAGLVP